MTEVYNVYCDESGYMERDEVGVMVLGAVWCPLAKARDVAKRLREIKAEHGRPGGFEVKWNKVSPAGAKLYVNLIDYFFDDDDLRFRTLIVPNKHELRHDRYGQTHDDWYYRMYFRLLLPILQPDSRYRIYLDIKDTRSAEKIAKLHEVLVSARYDFSRDIIERVQTVRSHEVELVQLADLLIGAVSYANRGLAGNAGKAAVAKRIQERSGHSLTRSTLIRDDKTNIFVWRASAA